MNCEEIIFNENGYLKGNIIKNTFTDLQNSRRGKIIENFGRKIRVLDILKFITN